MDRRATDASRRNGVDDFPRMYAATRRFSVGQPRNLMVLDGGRLLFLRTRNGDDPTLCLWQLDPGTGTEEIIVDPKALGHLDQDLPPAERARRERARESASGIVSYAVDRAGTRACFGLAGALFVIDLDTLEISSPTITGSVFDPRLSPDGTMVAYVSGDSLRLVEPGVDGSDRSIAASADPSISYGRAEFIAAEEMQRSRGYWWSPDSSHLLVARVNEAPVPRWWIADPAHPDHRPNEVRYPAAGAANAQIGLALIDLDGTQQRIAWDDDGRFEYLANIVWAAGHDPVVVRQTRDQREVSMAALDTETLRVREVRKVTEDTWVELIPSSPTLSEAGILTIEDILAGPNEPIGADRRSLVLDGKALTGIDLNVRSIVGTAGGHALITAWSVPSEIHLYAVALDGGRVTRLTTTPGVHGAALGPQLAGADAADTTDTDPADGPERFAIAVTAARPTADGLEVALRTLELDGAGERAPDLGAPLAFIEDVSHRPPIKAAPEFAQLGADRLESALFLPSGYDGDRPLPVLLDPYGGPHAQRVLKNQTSHLVSQWFAEQGFAVLVTDGRGTPGRGPAWERQVWGDLASPVLEDQLAALDAAAEDYGVLDLQRVAVRGWSFGGYLAALAVLRHPDRFHAAVAGAPVTTWRLYDTHYTERYLGRPDLHPQHYDATDLITEAPGLSRPLLLIHGLADDNVVAAHTLRFSTALLGAACPHRVLPLSGVTHMTPQEAVAENLLWLQLDFLKEALGLPSGVGAEVPAV